MLGTGAFGLVYECVDSRTGGACAAKVEPEDAPVPQLAYEFEVLRELTEEAKLTGFPRAYWLQAWKGQLVMLMDLLGTSVQALREASPGEMLPLHWVQDVATQALMRLRDLHSRGFVHRDLKPENLMYGVGDTAATLFLIDFGLCKRVVDPDSGDHIPFRDDKGVTGTVRYASLFTHEGIQHSMRDDIESLGYVLVFLARGHLPWQRARGGTDGVRDLKRAIDIGGSLCAGLPAPFVFTITHARSLPYGAMPDYDALLRKWTEPGAMTRKRHGGDGEGSGSLVTVASLASRAGARK
jgi:serine/threonine protein kinase